MTSFSVLLSKETLLQNFNTLSLTSSSLFGSSCTFGVCHTFSSRLLSCYVSAIKFTSLLLQVGLMPALCHPLHMTQDEARQQLQSHTHRNTHSHTETHCCTHSEALFVASVLQFVVAGVEREGLHDVGARTQELAVQLAH